MEKDKDIIQFEDLFKEQPKEIKSDQQPDHKGRYSSAIVVYLLIMFVLASGLYLLFGNLSSFQQTYTEDQLILENVAYDTQSLAVMDISDYNLYKDDYQDYVAEIGEYMGFVILTNANNTYYDSLFYETDPITGDSVISTDKIDQVFSLSPIITTWDSQDLTINIYAGESQVLPSFFAVDYQEITGPITQISDFGNAVLNFLVYLALLPLLLIILKRDFVFDFNVMMTRKSQWFTIIVIGYLYLMLGNIFSNYTSSFLGDIFGLTQSESLNQITVIRSLESSGAVLMILSAVIMGPIVEELIFRKSIFGLFKSDKWALIVSTLIFGSIHLVGEASILSALVNGLSYFVMGFIFGFIYIKNKRNIFAPLAVHILSNTISIIAILFIL